MNPRLLAAAGLIMLTACGPGAPDETGVCWRKTAEGRFTPVARDIDSLENCAVLLEGARLMGERNTDGAYQGYYIFVDAGRMASSSHASGYAYPILQPPQRVTVDRDLRQLIKERNGNMPAPGDLSLERK